MTESVSVDVSFIGPSLLSRSRRSSSALCRSEEHTSELQSPDHLVCRLLLEKKKKNQCSTTTMSPLQELESRLASPHYGRGWCLPKYSTLPNISIGRYACYPLSDATSSTDYS